MGKRLIFILWAMAPMQAFCLGSGAIVGNGPDSTSGAPGSFSTVAVATSAVLSGSVLTSSGSVIIVSTTPDAGHDTLSVRAQDNSAVFTVESLSSGTGKVGVGTNSPSTKMHMSSGTLLIDGSGSDVQFPAGVIGTSEIADSAVDTGKINTDAVDTAKIRSDSITTAKLADGSVNTAKIASDAVTTVKILDANVTAAKLVNAGVFTGDATTTFPALTIGNGAITAAKMVNSGVFTGDATTTFPALTIGALAIDTGKIASGAVDTTKILDGAVSTHKLLDTDHKVASLAVGYPVTGNNQLLVLGRVGIGTTLPQTKLHMSSGAFLLDGNQASPQVTIKGVTQAGINLFRTGNVAATSEPGSIDMRAPNASGAEKQWAYMAARVDDATDATEDSSLYFSSMKAGTLTEAMAIRSGNVGIGNTNPNVALVVTGAGHFTSSVTAGGDLLISKQYSPQLTFRRFTNFSGGDQPMYIESRGPNASGNDTIWHTETLLTPDATNGSEDSVYILAVQQAGTVTNKLVIGTGITAISSVTVQAAIQTNGAGSVFVSSTTQPTIACSAGTGTLALGSSDQAGKLTAGAAAANCTLTFATAYPKAPACFCNNETTTDLARATSTTTTLVCTSADGNFGAEVISYFCMGNP